MTPQFFKKLKNDSVLCLACAHQCQIKPNQTGICGVRKNQDGDLRLFVDNRPVAVNTDPIEKKPLYHFLPGSLIFSLGTIGCNFRCGFCQNWETSQNRLPTTDYGLQHAERWKPEKIVSYCLNNNIPSIAFTYNEPTIFIEYALDTIELAKKAGIKTVFVSNGYQSKYTADALVSFGLDAINIDLKSYSNKCYTKNCGAKLQPVLDNIKYFWNKGVWVEVTTLVVPGENDSVEELTNIAEFIYSVSPDLPWHISRFYPDYLMKDKPITSEKLLNQAYEIGRKIGIKHVYAGNINTKWGQDTVCPKCKAILIWRNDYQINLSDMFKKGRCIKCNTVIKGVWE